MGADYLNNLRLLKKPVAPLGYDHVPLLKVKKPRMLRIVRSWNYLPEPPCETGAGGGSGNPSVMTKDHLLYLNAVKSVEPLRKLFVLIGLPHHFQDNQP